MITPQQFITITSEAERLGIPRGFGRAILREYLQSEIIYLLSELRGSDKLALIGGTGLRLLYNLDRFSEDLDFDNGGLSPAATQRLFDQLVKQLQTRGYTVHWRIKSTGQERGGKLMLSHLLYDLGLSRHRDEKLMIKIEYTTPRPVPPSALGLLNRFGLTAQVVTEPLPALCARKLIALKERRRLQPRDLYDLTWFFSRRIAPDKKTLRDFGVRSLSTFREELLRLLHTHRSKFKEYERDLLPLVLSPEKCAAIRLLPTLLGEFLV